MEKPAECCKGSKTLKCPILGVIYTGVTVVCCLTARWRHRQAGIDDITARDKDLQPST